MKNTVMRIVAALLVAPLIADYLYFTINIFRDQPKYMMVHMEVFYILDILVLIAVVVGILISKYAISLIGIMAYETIYLISIFSQIGEFSSMSFMMILQSIPPLVIFTMILLLLTKMIKPLPVAIVIAAVSIIDLLLDLYVRVFGNHMNFFTWGNVRILSTNICLAIGFVLIVLLKGKKQKI